MENVTTLVIGRAIAKDPAALGLFMTYAADRIPVSDKIKMLGEIVQQLPDPSIAYEGLLDDLRAINRVRVTVAHSVFMGPGSGAGPPHYRQMRRGRMTRVEEDDLRAEVKDAQKRVKTAGPVLQAILDAALSAD